MAEDRNDTRAGGFTRLMGRSGGAAAEAALEIVYAELRALAQSMLERERPGHTLAATALVHEVYLKLVRQEEATYESRGQFMAIAATAMRRILVNHARDRKRLKRGGGAERVDLHEATAWEEDAPDELPAKLDESLRRLAQVDPRKVRVVEMRYFAGQTIEECASHLGISTAMVRRDWEFARAWLKRDLERDAGRGGAGDG